MDDIIREWPKSGYRERKHPTLATRSSRLVREREDGKKERDRYKAEGSRSGNHAA